MLPEDEPDPEAELRARLLLYRAHRDAGAAPPRDGDRPGRAVPPRAVDRGRRGPGRARARPTARRSIPTSSSGRSTGWHGSRRRPSCRPRRSPRTITLTERAAIIRAALRGAATSSSRTCSRGVRDRVVVAVTFLAMLELMKRREIVVSQAEPWGPIVARATTAEERAAAGRRALTRRRAARRVAWSRSHDRASGPIAPSRGRRREADAADVDPSPGAERAHRGQLEALLFVAERPLTRREIATLAGVDRATVDARLGDLEVALRRSRDPARAVGRPRRARHGARCRRPDRPLRRRGRDPPVAGLARDARDRRLPPARHASRRSSGSAASTRTTRSGRCSIAGSSSSWAGRRRPAGRSCTAPASSSSSGSA